MKNYKFDPAQFGYLSPSHRPKVLREWGLIHEHAFVKVICTSEDGSFWYSSCYKYPNSDERWVFNSGLYNATREDCSTSHTIYSGCITSERYAKTLLIHLLGTTTNEGTLKYGKERLLAKSLKVPIGKKANQSAGD